MTAEKLPDPTGPLTREQIVVVRKHFTDERLMAAFIRKKRETALSSGRVFVAFHVDQLARIAQLLYPETPSCE